MEDYLKIIAIIVTYNRKELLKRCLSSLFNQTYRCDLLVVDNASTDGTVQWITSQPFYNNCNFNYIRLKENTGGAGGFYEGIKYCVEKGCWDWVWLMDDDAWPEEDALAHLVKNVNVDHHVYGSAAVGINDPQKRLCFPAVAISGQGPKFIERYEQLAVVEKVAWLPFLGFFINIGLIKKIGYPDFTFFILDDDVEYSERAKCHGAEIYLVKESRIKHPRVDTVCIQLIFRRIYYRNMPPWKTYYDVRNKIIIAKRYYGFNLWTKTLPGIILRFFISLIIEDKKLPNIKAYLFAIRDGLLNRSS